MIFYILCFFVFSMQWVYSLENEPVRSSDVLEQIVIQSHSVRLRDELETRPMETVINQPSGNPDLKNILERIPGMQIRSVSGIGSLMSVTPLFSMNSGSAQVTIDDFPMINPLGTGFNFSLFPASLIEGLESRTGLASSLNVQKDVRPAPGGRVVLKTLTQKALSTQKLRGGATWGIPNTVTGNLAFGHFEKKNYEWIGGASFITTKGNFRYKNQSTKNIEYRDHNDATGFGALVKGKQEFASGWNITSVLLASHLDRTLPGGLSYPTRDHEKDEFEMLGVQAKKDGFFSKFTANHSRTGTQGDPNQPWSSTDDRVFAGVFQTGYTHDFMERQSVSIVGDFENQSLKTNTGIFFRSISGITFSSTWVPFSHSGFTISPLFRQEVANQYSRDTLGQRDYRIGIFYPFMSKFFLEGGFSYDHLYPDITAHNGYMSGFGLVRGNSNLNVERYKNWDLGLNFSDEILKFSVSSFFHRIRNRSIFSSNYDGTASFESIPEVQHWGGLIHGQIHGALISFQNTLILQQAKDLQTQMELPYKPRVQNLTSIGLHFNKSILFSIEERFDSWKRFSATGDGQRGDPWLKPWWATGLRLDWTSHSSLLCFFKVDNLFEKDADEYPGFPRPGRTFYLGLTSPSS